MRTKTAAYVISRPATYAFSEDDYAATHLGPVEVCLRSRRPLPACQSRRATPCMCSPAPGAQRRVAGGQWPSLRVGLESTCLRRCPPLQGKSIAAGGAPSSQVLSNPTRSAIKSQQALAPHASCAGQPPLTNRGRSSSSTGLPAAARGSAGRCGPRQNLNSLCSENWARAALPLWPQSTPPHQR